MKQYNVETKEDGFKFRFRLVCSDGRKTYWAGYTDFAILDDMAAGTGYALPPELALKPLPLKQVAEAFGTGEDKSTN